MSRVLLATSNPNKITELKQLIAALSITSGVEVEVLTPQDFPNLVQPNVVESGDTYGQNAIAKALGFYQVYRAPVLADDSGIEVDALGGAPGVHSARFGGGAISASARNALLLAQLSTLPKPWTARFRCVLAYFDGDKPPQIFEGEAEGEVIETPVGVAGFGYDPVFFSYEIDKSFAQATELEKAAVSHRGKAVYNWIEFLRVQARLS